MNQTEKAACYTVAVQRDFVARHFLVGGDWGAENELHSHHYKVEVRLEGAELDRHGYLVDIVDIEQSMDALVVYYRDRVLNELKEFEGLNPSIEHLARLWCDAVSDRTRASNISAVSVRVWENDIAWAAYRRERK